MWTPLSRSPEAAAAVEGRSGYFTTESHYLALANRIVAALHGRGCVLLITSDPPAVPHLLSQALRAADKSRHAVISIACRPDLTSEELLRARSIVAVLPSNGEATEWPQPLEAAPAVVLFADADQLSDERIREICSPTEHDRPKDIAVLLLARPTFLARLEERSLQFLKEQGVIQFKSPDVHRDGGIEVFQLAARKRRKEQTGVATGAARTLAALGIFLLLASGAFLFFVNDHLAGLKPTSSDGNVASLSRLPHTPAAEAGRVISNVSLPAATGAPSRTPQPAPLVASLAPDLLETARQAAPQPAPTSAAPQPAPTSVAPQPTPTSAAPQPAPTSAAPQPAPTSVAPQPAPTSAAPQPAPTSVAPQPAPTSVAPQPAPTSVAPQPAPTSVAPQPAPISAASPNPQPSSAEIAALITRGDGFLGTRDITSARLFYERAVDAGSAPAALRLGATFDPGALSGAGMREIFGDVGQAASWYRRARDLGDPAAESRLENLHRERAGEQNQSHR